jgi:sterol desaturase/sphingolipid hydroxylase (fatty acid hydroxylase superfamily)
MAEKQQQEQQPLVLEVGKMGTAYWTWVHKPVLGKPRFFHSTVLENITRCPWWLVPLVWLPIYIALSTHALQLGVPMLQLVSLQVQGVLLWQFLEYLIHRFFFHCKVSSYWGITVHFLFHGNHHKFPKDGDRLVFPPVPAAAIASSIYAGLRVFLDADLATGLMSGVILGYVAYDCLHYSMHHAAYLPGGFLQELKLRHSHHHYQDSDHGYGISSVIYDVLLGTRATGLQ